MAVLTSRASSPAEFNCPILYHMNQVYKQNSILGILYSAVVSGIKEIRKQCFGDSYFIDGNIDNTIIMKGVVL